jgi:CRISPR/Cas system endoribonuclease Cas6 (RAMP superfamily)
MRPAWLYRAASVLFFLFAAGHTFGFLNFKPPTAEGLAVRDAMNNVHFGANFSYGSFYAGFGLYVTLYLLFSAFLAWHLSRLASRLPQAIGALGWAFFAVQLASIALSCVYIAEPPAVFSALVAACLGWAMWQVRGAEAQAAMRFGEQRGGA